MDYKDVSFSLKDTFVQKYKWKQPDWGPLGYFTYKRCVTIDTPILTEDLRWVDAGDMSVGDRIIAFDEVPYRKNASGGNLPRLMRTGTIDFFNIEEAECVEILMSNGDRLKCTPDHSWLVRFGTDNRLQWIEAKDLLNRSVPCYIPKYMNVEEPDRSYEAGYLAAALDGEGSVDRKRGLVFSQCDNEMLLKVKRYLNQYNFKYSIKQKSRATQSLSSKPCFDIRIQSNAEVMRFLSLFRPPRLLRNYVDSRDSMIMRRKLHSIDPPSVVSVTPIGVQKIAVISTSTKTHITGGYPSHNTYARPLSSSKSEEFWQTLQRVVEGCFVIQKQHCYNYHLPWNERRSQRSAQEMYNRMWEFKFLPPGRGLWAMGSEFAFKKGGACLNNCGFVSTADILHEFSAPFVWLMDMSLLGVGVGFDTKGAFQDREVFLKAPRTTKEPHVVEDSREGWVAVFKRILDSYDGNDSMPEAFNYSQIRPEGAIIKSFGGIAPGPAPLDELVRRTTAVLDTYVSEEKPVDSTLIVDLMNLAGAAVVAGGIRRSSEIALGTMDDEEFNNLKTKEALDNPALARWASNNTHIVEVGDDYTEAAKRTAENGEPGYFWIQNARDFGRLGDPPTYSDHRVMGTNPCGEQSLESYELCVTGDTRIQTREGFVNIKSTIGRLVDVWNGKEWSPVTPFKASDSSNIFRVTFNDGSYLDCTADHRFSIRAKTRKHFVVKKTKELTPGDILPKFNLGNVFGKAEPLAYNYGLFAGDGFIDGSKTMIYMQEEAISTINPDGVLYKPSQPVGYTKPMQRVVLDLDFDICLSLRDYSTGLPPVLFSWDADSVLQFVAGLIDTDGSIGNKDKLGEYYRIYGSEQKLRELQGIVRRANINRTSLKLFQPKGTKTNKGTRNQDLWMLNIHSKYCKIIPTRYKKATTFSTGYVINNAHPQGSKISKESQQKVVSVEPLNKQATYCFYEPKEGMGVFGNVLTYQCNLVESFPIRCDSKEDYFKTLKYAYLYAKTVTLLRTHDPRSNQVMTRNRRIGLSQSGIVENIKRVGFREHMRWCDEGYAVVKQWDKTYSEWLGVPESIKKTTVKPSGSVSLLPGVTPGVHHGHAEYYIRRIRVARTSHLVQAMQNAGYNVVPDRKLGSSTMVVSFPVHEPFFSKRKEDVTMMEQLELAAQMQHYWSDNQVSVTVTVTEEEGANIATALSMYETRLKSVSFLPLWEHGYEQAPYEEITAERYADMVSGLKRPKLNIGLEDEGKLMDKFCDGEVCEI